MSELTPPTAPYPGLRAYQENEAAIFVGRDEQIGHILERLKRHHLVVVLGASGCGKSSIVRAGVVPRLVTGGIDRVGDFWLSAYMRPGTDPLGNLGAALLRLLDQPTPADRDRIAELLRDVDGLAAFRQEFAERFALDPIMRRLPPEQQARERARINLLVVADQFEEIFNEANLGRRRTEDLVDLLTFIFREAAGAADDGPQARVFVVLTMRSEYVGAAATFLRMPDVLNRAFYLVRRLDGRELEEVIDQPLISWTDPASEETSRISIAPDLRRQLLDETLSLRDDPDHLPLLQHALGRLWWLANEKARSGDGAAVIDQGLVQAAKQTPASYRARNPVRAADGLLFELLEGHAEQVYQSLSPADRRLAELMFRELTDTEAAGSVVRRLVSAAAVAEVADGMGEADVVRVAMVFADEEHDFIQTRTASDGTRQLDIAHEALVRKWPRCQDWAEEEARLARQFHNLTHAAHVWRDHGRPADNLFDGTQLDHAVEWLRPGRAWTPNEAWARRYGDDGDYRLVKEFIEASRADQERERREEAERQRKQVRRRHVLMAAAIGTPLALAFIALVAVGFYMTAGEILFGKVVQKSTMEAGSAVRAVAELRKLPDAEGGAPPTAAEVTAAELWRLLAPLDRLGETDQTIMEHAGKIDQIIESVEEGSAVDFSERFTVLPLLGSHEFASKDDVKGLLAKDQQDVEGLYVSIRDFKEQRLGEIRRQLQALPAPLFPPIDLVEGSPVSLGARPDGSAAVVATDAGRIVGFIEQDRPGDARYRPIGPLTSDLQPIVKVTIADRAPRFAVVAGRAIEVWDIDAARPVPWRIAEEIVDLAFNGTASRLAAIGIHGAYAELALDNSRIPPVRRHRLEPGWLYPTVAWLGDQFCFVRFRQEGEPQEIQVLALVWGRAGAPRVVACVDRSSRGAPIASLSWQPPRGVRIANALLRPEIALPDAATPEAPAPLSTDGTLVVVASDNTLWRWRLSAIEEPPTPILTTGSIALTERYRRGDDGGANLRPNPILPGPGARGVALQSADQRSLSLWHLAKGPGDAVNGFEILSPSEDLLAEVRFRDQLAFFAQDHSGRRLVSVDQDSLDLWSIADRDSVMAWDERTVTREACRRIVAFWPDLHAGIEGCAGEK